MKTLAIIALAVLSGCAAGGLRSQWVSRGYSEADIAEIHKYEDGYLNTLGRGAGASNAFDTSQQVNAENRIRSIFCACIVKLGDKCRQNPEGLSESDRTLWAKSNAAEDALRGFSMAQLPLVPMSDTDPAECH